MHSRFKPSDIVSIDKRDEKIISALCKNARTPVSEIAKSVRLSRDAVAYRIDQYQKKGLFQGFVPNIDFRSLGFYSFHVFVLLDESLQKMHQSFIEFVKSHPAIYSLIEYNDRWDYEIVFVARSLSEFDEALMDLTSEFPKLFLEKAKVEVMKRYVLRPHPFAPIIVSTPKSKQNLDAQDQKILLALEKNATDSSYVIAKNTTLSPDAIRYRMKKLEQNVITQYIPICNFVAFGLQMYTLSIRLSMLSREQESRLEEFLRQNPEVIRAAKTLGGWDILLYVVSPSPREYHIFVKKIKRVFADVIRSYETWMVTEELFYDAVPDILFISQSKEN